MTTPRARTVSEAAELIFLSESASYDAVGRSETPAVHRPPHPDQRLELLVLCPFPGSDPNAEEPTNPTQPDVDERSFAWGDYSAPFAQPAHAGERRASVLACTSSSTVAPSVLSCWARKMASRSSDAVRTVIPTAPMPSAILA